MSATTDAAPPLPTNIERFFPMPAIRSKQAKALDYIQRMVARDVKDIIISAPTGVGKSAIGLAAGFWSGQHPFPIEGKPGAYYLCTQKLLQDQLERDILAYPPQISRAASVKSSSAYECRAYGNCAAGLAHKPVCTEFKSKTCTYQKHLAAFLSAEVGITNYPYFFTSTLYNETLTDRRFLIADECHTLETQLLQFAEVVVGPEEVEKFAAVLGEVPNLKTLEDFGSWLAGTYLPVLETRMDRFDKGSMTGKEARQYQELLAHTGKVIRAIEDFDKDPDNWVFWTEKGNPTGFGSVTAYAKPLVAVSYFDDLIRSQSHTRIYMSAYPGSKDIFCRSLGLDASKTAMLNLGSVFPVEHRPIHITPIGSMGRRSQEETLPRLLKLLERMFKVHGEEKGIIHCNSYALGKAIFEHFRSSTDRLLFPSKASERENVYKFHLNSRDPTVILSPSFTEGFDFIDASARWQVIAKIPYPYLGDRQVAAKKDIDPEWYALRTVMTLIQATGRICRSEEDYGTTYVTDSDFEMLYRKYEYMFPAWWRAALNTP